MTAERRAIPVRVLHGDRVTDVVMRVVVLRRDGEPATWWAVPDGAVV